MSDKWDNRFLEMAKLVSTWSKDPSSKVGAVLTQGKQVVGLGYNGFPRGMEDTEARYADREAKYAYVVHAEVNACLMAGEKARGASLYVYPAFAMPNICNECCKVAIQSGIKEVVGYPPLDDPERQARWARAIALAATMLREAGVTWRTVEF